MEEKINVKKEEEIQNIYRKNLLERMKECYNEQMSIYDSMKKGISAKEELDKLFEITKIEFHTIPYKDNKGSKYMFLKGILKGIECAQKIVENRSRKIEKQSDVSTRLEFSY